VTPWVVEVDRLGEPRVTAPAVQGARATDPMIAWTLARFITDVRAVSTDPVVMRQAWLRAYDFTDANGAAALSDYARRNDPFAQVGRTQVVVTVSSVVRATPSSFRVAWIEQRYADGQLAATERWSAILTLVVKPPRTAEGLRSQSAGRLRLGPVVVQGVWRMTRPTASLMVLALVFRVSGWPSVGQLEVPGGAKRFAYRR
jgi:type IV secretory pathway TrbF-like protein